MILGRGPAPLFVLQVVRGLPDTSLTSALASGGIEYYGWGVDRYLLAEMYDSLNLNTQASGQWKGKPPQFKPFPRPQNGAKKKKGEKVTVRDLYTQYSTQARR